MRFNFFLTFAEGLLSTTSYYKEYYEKIFPSTYNKETERKFGTRTNFVHNGDCFAFCRCRNILR